MDRRFRAWWRTGVMALVAAGLLTALVLAVEPIAPIVAQPLPQTTPINLAYEAYTVDEDAGTLVVTATLTPPNTEFITVTFSTANINATSPADYTGMRRRLSIPPGTTLIQTEVPIVDDRLVEGDESFEIGLSIPQNATLGDRITATVQIRNNDVARLHIEDIDVWENAGTAVITVTQSTTSTLQTYVNIFTEDDSAVAGADYETIPPFTVLGISPGKRSASLAITLHDNDTAGANKQFRVRLADPLNAAIAQDTAIVTMLDDDALPALNIGDATAMEGDEALHFTLTLDEPAAIAVQIDYKTVDSSAVTPDDYTHVSGHAIIPTGATSTTITVLLVDDTLIEGDERFHITLSKVVAANIATNQATGTIQDDDQVSTAGHRVYLPGIVVE